MNFCEQPSLFLIIDYFVQSRNYGVQMTHVGAAVIRLTVLDYIRISFGGYSKIVALISDDIYKLLTNVICVDIIMAFRGGQKCMMNRAGKV